MKPGRNDPCPCGSGRKYKQCCEKAERNVGGTALGGAAGRRVREAAANTADWCAEVVPLGIDVGREPAQRPAAVMVTAAGFVVVGDLRIRVGSEVEQIAELIESAVLAAGREVGSLPERVLVRHQEVAEELRPRLEPREIQVEQVRDLPELAEAARSLMEELTGGGHWPPIGSVLTWSGWGLPHDRVREIFDAAAEFWRRAPWKIVTDMQTPELITPSGRRWSVLVLGNAEMEFGLALHSEATDLSRLVLNKSGSFEKVRGRILSLTFDPGSELPAAMRREIASARWPVASADAHPVLFTVNAPGGGCSLADAEDLIAALRAAPDFAEACADVLRHEEKGYELLEPILYEHAETGVTLNYQGLSEAMLDELARRMEPSELDTDDMEDLDGWDGLDDPDVQSNPATRAFMQEMRGIFEGVVSEKGEDADWEEVSAEARRRIAARQDEYNETPQEDLVGLAPVQVNRLIGADLMDPAGPLRIRSEVDPAAVQAAPLLRDLRLLVELAAERGGLPTTTLGNLKVKVVAKLLHQLETAARSRKYYEPGDRCWEEDVPAVHRVRVLAELADLIELRGSKFEATALGRKLIDPARSGELLAVLFRTYFGTLNLDYFGLRPWPELQHQIVVTLYGLSQLRGPATAEELLETVVLPFARDAGPESPAYDFRPGHLANVVFERLVEMGLLERSGAEEEKGAADDPMYMKTPLFDEFLGFDL